jgi:hypothetical protein
VISIIRYTLLTAVRDLLFFGLFILVLCAIGVSFTLGGTALVEQEQMVLSYIAGSVRIILITGIVLFICFHVRRSFENKEIDLILSRPISRTSFMLSYWFGFTVLALMLTLPIIGVMAIITKSDPMGLAFWSFSLLCEIALISAFALVSSLIMQSAVTSALSTLGFYLLARMMGFFILTVKSMPASVSGDFESKITWLMEKGLQVVSVTFPRLDLFGKTSWLLYGLHDAPNLWIVPVQSLIFIPFLLSIAVFDFKRKQF